MNTNKIVELIEIIKDDLLLLYTELKEFPSTEYKEQDFIEKAKFTLLKMLGTLIE